MNNDNIKITNNNGSFNAEINYEGIRADIYADVKALLEKKGSTVLNKNFNAGREVTKLVEKAEKLKEEANNNIKHVKATYSESVAASKVNVLNYNLRMDLKDIVEELGTIKDRDAKFKDAELKKAQADKHYKEARNEAYQMLGLLKDVQELPDDVLADFINPMVEAMDIKSLTVAELIMGQDTINGKKIAIAKEGIQDYLANEDLSNYIFYAKTYVELGENPVMVDMYKAHYK